MSATASPKTSSVDGRGSSAGSGGSSVGSNSPAPMTDPGGGPVTPSPRTSRSLQVSDHSGGGNNNEDHGADTDPEANGTTSRSPPLPPPPLPTTSTPSPSASTSTRDTVTPGPKKPIPEQNEQDSRTMGGGSHSAGGGRRPVKVWNSGRTIRKALVVSTYEEFQRKGREKLGLSSEEPISIVLEGDGTQVDDGEYFQTLPENSIFMFLRTGESWHPTGSDSIKAVMEAIPSIICDTLYSLGLHDQTPSWKIMDNKGRITVVLHWEPDDLAALKGATLPAIAGPSRQSSTCSTIASGGPRLLGIHTRSISQRSGSSVSSTPCLSRDNSRQGVGIHQHSMLVQTSFDSHRDSGKGTLGPHITVINHDVDAAKASAGGLLGPPGALSRGSSGGSSLVMGTPSPRQLSRQGSSMESTAIVPIHHHTAECSAAGRVVHQPTTYSKQGGSPTSDCDFHCCTLHIAPCSTGGPATTSSTAAGTITTTSSSTHKSTAATSPMQQAPSQTEAGTTTATSSGGLTDGKRSLPKGAHVRFSHVMSVDGAAQDTGLNTATTLPSTTANNQSASIPTTSMNVNSAATNSQDVAGSAQSSFQCRAIVETTTTMTRVTTTSEAAEAAAASMDPGLEDSSESETDNNDETGTTDKFLLLIDQLSSEQPHHLSIKDIGIILDRLSSKIIDVDQLERQIEDGSTRNWTIKATIRGQVMRELGVIYNSNYYAISEHPNFSFSKRIHLSEVESGGRQPPGLDDEDLEDDMDDFEEVDHPGAVDTLFQATPPLHQ